MLQHRETEKCQHLPEVSFDVPRQHPLAFFLALEAASQLPLLPSGLPEPRMVPMPSASNREAPSAAPASPYPRSPDRAHTSYLIRPQRLPKEKEAKLVFDPTQKQKELWRQITEPEASQDQETLDQMMERLLEVSNLFGFMVHPALTSEERTPEQQAAAVQRIQNELVLVQQGKYEAVRSHEVTLSSWDVSDALYEEIRDSIMDIYLLGMPVADPESFPAIEDAETRLLRRAATSEVRSVLLGAPQKNLVKAGKRVWNSQLSSTHATEIASLTYIDREDLEPKHAEHKDNLNWMEEGGLADHTLTAAELLRTIVSIFQSYILDNTVETPAQLPKEPTKTLRTKNQAELLELNANASAIRILFHDAGRFLTHHRVNHEYATQWILELAGIKPEFAQEPSIINFFSEDILRSIYSNSKDGATHNLEGYLFHLCDFLGKPSASDATKIRRPEDISAQSQLQDKKYLTGADPRSDLHGYYGLYETRFLNSLLFWIEDTELGLGIPRDVFTQCFDQIEAETIPKQRAKYGFTPKRNVPQGRESVLPILKAKKAALAMKIQAPSERTATAAD